MLWKTNLTELPNKKNQKGKEKNTCTYFYVVTSITVFYKRIFEKKFYNFSSVSVDLFVFGQKICTKDFFSIFLSFFEVAIKLKNHKSLTQTFQVILRNFGIFKLIIKAMATKKYVLCRIIDKSVTLMVY